MGSRVERQIPTGIMPLLLVLVGMLAGLAAATATPAAEGHAKAPFEPLRKRLLEAKQAVVSSACGSAISPWAYRGERGKALTLQAYRKGETDARWASRFADALMRAADWDTVEKFRGRSKPCNETHQVPLFIVSFQGSGPQTWALLSFETRSAQLFLADRPLGTIHFEDRADTLFALLQRALPNDSLVAAMRTPPVTRPSTDESIRLIVGIDSLPVVLQKVPPKYPQQAVASEVEGVVEINALVGADGTVKDAFVRHSRAMLDDAALEAVWQWRFRPALSKGQAYAVWIAVPVRFRLH